MGRPASWMLRGPRLRFAASGWGMWLLFSGADPTHAAGFSVNPVRLELKPAQNATSLTIANYNPDPLFMQVRVYRWEHKDGADSLSEVDGEAPLVTPPLFRLGPNGGSQVVRIGFTASSTPPTEEHQWRVIVEEVPKAPIVTEPGSDAAPPLSVAVHMRVSLPLFQRPLTVKQQIAWTLERAAIRLPEIERPKILAAVTERLDEVHLGPNDDVGAKVLGPVYVFPGEHRAFDMHPKAMLPAGSVRLSVQGTPRPLVGELLLSAQ